MDKVQNYGFLNPNTGYFKGTKKRVLCKNMLSAYCNFMVPVSIFIVSSVDDFKDCPGLKIETEFSHTDLQVHCKPGFTPPTYPTYHLAPTPPPPA